MEPPEVFHRCHCHIFEMQAPSGGSGDRSAFETLYGEASAGSVEFDIVSCGDGDDVIYPQSSEKIVPDPAQAALFGFGCNVNVISLGSNSIGNLSNTFWASFRLRFSPRG